jgi:thermostable 8-oxoguanine DNA glycosylase
MDAADLDATDLDATDLDATDLDAFVSEHLDRYGETQGVLPERLDEFGEAYRSQGYLTREQLYEIAYESSTRSAYHVEKNPEARCREVTRNARTVEGDFSAIHLITGLSGFKAPTASCVLAALDGDRHAVVDTRVWASLERLDYLDGRKESFDAADYVTMIEPIREIADETGYSAVDVGYALFAYDDRVREGTLH